MPLQGILKWNGVLITASDAFQNTFGQVHVLEIVEVLEDSFADIKGLGAAGAASEFFQALFRWIGEGE